MFEQPGDPLGLGARFGGEHERAVVRQVCGASAGRPTGGGFRLYIDDGTGRTAGTSATRPLLSVEVSRGAHNRHTPSPWIWSFWGGNPTTVPTTRSLSR
jgi:hypothetical protein